MHGDVVHLIIICGSSHMHKICQLEESDVLKAVVGETARDFARAIVMPNLVPPVVTAAEAIAYRERILAHTNNSSFLPLMTLYLTESSDPSNIKLAAKEGIVNAVKLYPAGATTNSDSGVTSIDRVMPALEAMVEADLPLCVHGEVTDPEIDIFDREAVFIERVLIPLRKKLPDLRVVMEHVTTREGVQYVQSESGNIGATITPHHLIINRNDLLVGGIRPHYYCLPIAKRELHRQALRKAVTLIVPRMQEMRKRAPADVRVCSMRPIPCLVWRRFLKKKMHLISWKGLHLCTVRGFIDWR